MPCQETGLLAPVPTDHVSLLQEKKCNCCGKGKEYTGNVENDEQGVLQPVGKEKGGVRPGGRRTHIKIP